jgi:hypothetical protein
VILASVLPIRLMLEKPAEKIVTSSAVLCLSEAPVTICWQLSPGADT